MIKNDNELSSVISISTARRSDRARHRRRRPATRRVAAASPARRPGGTSDRRGTRARRQKTTCTARRCSSTAGPGTTLPYSRTGPSAGPGNHSCPTVFICSYYLICVVDTVKAPNFGPHGNSGPLFQKGLLSLKRIVQKNEENKSCRKPLDLQICFCSYFVHDSSKEATQLIAKKKVQSFHEVQS
jgi:hypothetical protein